MIRRRRTSAGQQRATDWSQTLRRERYLVPASDLPFNNTFMQSHSGSIPMSIIARGKQDEPGAYFFLHVWQECAWEKEKCPVDFPTVLLYKNLPAHIY